MLTKTATPEQKAFASKLSLMKHEAYAIGLYRTGRLIEVPLIEVGWELQNELTPPTQRERQQATIV